MQKQRHLVRKSLGLFGASCLLMWLMATASLAADSYTVEGKNPDGNMIISQAVLVSTSEWEPSTGGAPKEINKYGIMTPDGEILIAPMIDHTDGQFGPFTLGFDDDGFSQQVYGADFYYYGGMGESWQPDGCKKLLVNQDYKLWKDYDQFYDQFATDNRFIIKDGNVSYMIDRDMNIITDQYAHIIELDDGKWYASTDTSQTAPVYNVVLDNNGNVLTDFDTAMKDVVSPWATPYLTEAKEQDMVTDTTFATQPVTRNEFCRLAVSTLKFLDFVPPENLQSVSYSDTQDKNVLYLSQLGVINGVGNGKFDSYADITREEAAKILVNLANLLKLDTTAKIPATGFADSNLISSWATDYVFTISALQTEDGEAIMGGTTATTFAPQKTYTLEQAITTLVRLTACGGSNPAVTNLGRGYVDFSPFSDGYALVYTNPNQHFFLDETGTPLTVENGPYKSMSSFQNGLARVVDMEGKWGMIDTTGREVLPCQYDYIGDFQAGYTVGETATGGDILDTKLHVTPVPDGLDNPYLDCNGNLISATQDIVTGPHVKLYTRAGELLCEADEITPYPGYYRTEVDGKRGCIDKDGHVILPNQYGTLNLSIHGETLRFVVHIPEKGDFLLDETGTPLHDVAFLCIDRQDTNLFVVTQDFHQYGLLDENGNLLTDLIYNWLCDDGADWIYGQRDGHVVYLDRNGKEVLSLESEHGEIFSQGLAAVSEKNDNYVYPFRKMGYVNPKGEFVVPCI